MQAQDHIAGEALELALWVITERALSMKRHQDSYPHALARAFSQEPDAKQNTLNSFRVDWEAYSSDKKSTLPERQDAARESTLDTRAMQDMARLARRGNWNAEECQDFFDRAWLGFSCWGQENVVETSMQALRHHESQDSPAKDMSMWRQFSVLVTSNILERFGVEGIDRKGELPVPPELESLKKKDKWLFQRVGTSPSQDLLEQIQKQRTWVTGTAQTVRPLACKEAFRRFVWENGLAAKRADAWVAGLLPQHQFILAQQPGGNVKGFFTLAVFDKGALCWPVRLYGNNRLRIKSKGANVTPEWRFFFDADMLKVATTVACSPMRVAAEHLEIPIDQVTLDISVGAVAPLLSWQAAHGFANVRETVLRKLCISRKLKLPEQEALTDDVETQMALQLIMSLLPDVTEPLCQRLMRYRVDMDDDDDPEDPHDSTLPIDQFAILDTCERNDAEKSMQWKNKTAASKASKATRLQKATTIVKSAFVGLKKQPPASKAVNSILKKDKVNKSKTNQERWTNSLKLTDDTIMQLRPPCGGISVDQTGGRVLVSYACGLRRSVSWYRRGEAAASRVVLDTLWTWHCEATGESMPAFPWCD